MLNQLLKLILLVGVHSITPNTKIDELMSTENENNDLTDNIDVYCKIKVPKVAEQKWTLLQVHFGHNCKALYHDSMERCCA